MEVRTKTPAVTPGFPICSLGRLDYRPFPGRSVVVVVVQLLQVELPCFSWPFGPLVSVVIVVWPWLVGLALVLVFPPEPWVEVLPELLPKPVLLPAAKVGKAVLRANAAAAVTIKILFIGYSTRARGAASEAIITSP